MRLRLCENLRAYAYAPFYFALSHGTFAAEQLEIEHVCSPAMSSTATMLLDGAADVAWGGPMRVMMHHAADPDCPLVCFAQAVARDPFILLAREPNPCFRFADLLGPVVAVASETPTAWLTFQDDLARAGIDPAALVRAPEMTMPESAAALLAGSVDVVQVFEPHADALLERDCHVWHRFSDRGDIAYTAFYATRSYLAANREACRRLVRGFAAALRGLHRADLAAIAAAMQPFFPEADPAALTRVVRSYREAALWPRTPALPPAAFVRLKAALLSGGLIATDLPYDRIVDPGLSLAEPD
jgi:NitT/TauT family transport system substrate-binding protein